MRAPTECVPGMRLIDARVRVAGWENRPKYYVPRNPYQAPSYYPQTTNQTLSSPRLFGQLDVETLFYVFYFLPGTYQQ